ncbi:MAG: glycerol-3-phosphate ABC transporter ATP-binding protein [Phycisphaerae bacterium]|nr:glycerol-3-phosphate ABC transporter ATP-binding protein [Phycisphaerae bacterium]
MANVEFNSVWKTYAGDVHAVRGVDLSIADGEFVVLVGPSGCGKSTTLRMVAGLESISDGEISIGGRVVNGVDPKDRDIAMVFQNYALYPHMSVYQNLSFALRMRKTPKAEIDKRVREAATTLGIETLLERKPKALSGGQRQRVAVGRAIVRDPKVFLFDEPLSNLDAKLRTETRADLKALHQRLRTTTIYVTHDQEEAMTLGDRVVVMAEGVIQQADTPFEVFRRPANRFVAGFIGTPPMCFFEGRIERDGGVRFVGRAGADGRPSLAIELGEDQAAAMNGREAVTLGVRPTSLAWTRSPIEPEASIVATPRVVEPLGERMDVHLETLAGERLLARVPASDGMPIGEPTRFALEREEIHFFEPGPFGARVGAAEVASV